jgi:raffinose/stachyose/melibiose transport system permease protein
MAATVVPFLSLFVTALHPAGTYPPGLDWPSDPRWGNFAQAFRTAHMAELLTSSVLIVLGVVPVSLLIATMAGFALGHLRMVGRRLVFLTFVLGLTLPFDPAKRAMAGALGAFQGQWGTDIPLLCAGSLLILAPTLAVFLIFQRRFVSALLQGSLKG